MTISNFQLIVSILRLLVPVVLIAAVGWFAWKANRENRNPLTWGFFAAAAFLVPYKLTKTLVIYIVDSIEQSSGNILALVVTYHLPPILAGIFGCYLLKKYVDNGSLRNSTPTEPG